MFASPKQSMQKLCRMHNERNMLFLLPEEPGDALAAAWQLKMASDNRKCFIKWLLLGENGKNI